MEIAACKERKTRIMNLKILNKLYFTENNCEDKIEH